MCPCAGMLSLNNPVPAEKETGHKRHDVVLVLAMLLALAVNVVSWIAYIGPLIAG